MKTSVYLFFTQEGYKYGLSFDGGRTATALDHSAKTYRVEGLKEISFNAKGWANHVQRITKKVIKIIESYGSGATRDERTTLRNAKQSVLEIERIKKHIVC